MNALSFTQVAKLSNKKPVVGIALGSGSARGLAHIGVIHALEEAGITVDVVAGTSIGALIGSVYAAGRIDAIERDYLSFDWKKVAAFMDVVLPRSGLIDGQKVEDFIRQYIHALKIEHLPKPFQAVATDLGTGQEVIFKEGDTIKAVRASIAAPGIFTPVRVDGRILVDGGLVNPVPVSVVKAMGADRIIAVDLNHDIVQGKATFKAQAQQEDETEDEEESALSELLNQFAGEKYKAAMEELNRRLQTLGDQTRSIVNQWFEEKEEPLPNIFEILLSSFNILENQITETRLKIDPPDLLIRPPLGSVRFLEFHRAGEMISIGYEETRRLLEADEGKMIHDLTH